MAICACRFLLGAAAIIHSGCRPAAPAHDGDDLFPLASPTETCSFRGLKLHSLSLYFLLPLSMSSGPKAVLRRFITKGLPRSAAQSPPPRAPLPHSHNALVASPCFLCPPAGGPSGGPGVPPQHRGPRAYLCSVEGPSVPAGSQVLGVAPAPV
jgi:hypothetical protein